MAPTVLRRTPVVDERVRTFFCKEQTASRSTVTPEEYAEGQSKEQLPKALTVMSDISRTVTMNLSAGECHGALRHLNPLTLMHKYMSGP